MNKPSRILIARSAYLSQDSLSVLFCNAGIEVEFCEPDGKELLERLKFENIDIVLADIFTAGFDAIELKKRYEQIADKTVLFFGILPAANNYVEEMILRAGFVHYFIRPSDEAVVFSSILEYMTVTIGVYNKSNTDELSLSQYLRELNVPADFQGYSCLKEAILIYTRDGTARISITKEIYPCIAKSARLSVPCVEKVIRNVIENAWGYGSIEKQRQYFGYDRTMRKRPTNLKFVATLANHLWLEQGTNCVSSDVLTEVV